MMKVGMPDIRRNPGAGRHRGLTLTELIVAIALFVLVLGLLGFPLFSAFGYIQKAIAQSEAQTAGRKVAKQLRQEIERAGYVFAIPPGGESVSFIPSDESGAVFASASAENYAVLYRNYENAEAVRFVRYGRVLDFPWVWDGGWLLLQPNDSEAGAEDRYERHHYPFYSKNAESQRSNPYVVARYQYPQDDLSFRSATVLALNASYPMSYYNTAVLGQRDQNVLTRLFRDDMVAVTPYGEDWDVSQFTVRPMRVATEALQRPTDGSAVCTSVFAKYPLWAGRSRDLDEYEPSLLDKFYSPLVDMTAPDPLADLRRFVGTEYPLYQLYPDTATGPIAAAQNWRNPFGYQIRVYNKDGEVAFGMFFDKTATPPASSPVCHRHYMEWPPINRYDMASQNLAGEWIYNTGDPDVRQWRTDVLRQRAAGQVVFEQPMRIQNLQVTEASPIFTAKLPTPDDTKWIDGITYLVSPSPVIRVTDGLGNVETFTLAKSEKAFTAGTFYFPNLGATNWYSGDTRVVQFKAKGTLNAGDWTVVNPSDTRPYRYTICDLQPTDTVVATYSTQGMLDLGMTLSRRDRSGQKLESGRQNYTMNLRVEAKNAMRRARR